MIKNSKHTLNTGPFSLCSKIWDSTSNTFKIANSVEKNKCCLQSCMSYIKKCYNLCPNSKNSNECQLKCDNIQKSCNDYCTLSTKGVWGVNNPIYEGIKKYNCGDGYYHHINNECVKKNKNNIISLCNKQCIPKIDVDCKKHCQYSYDYIINKKDVSSTIKTNERNKKILQKGNRSTVYILYSLGLSIIFSMLFLYLIEL